MSRTTRCRWPAHGASSFSICSSVPPRSPVKNHPMPGRLKSPMLRASGSPLARCSVSAAVQAPTPGHCAQPGECRLRRQPGRLLDPVRDRRGRPDRPLPLPVHAEAMPVPRRHRKQVGRRRWHPQLGMRSRRRTAEPAQQPSPSPSRLAAGDPLLEDGGNERVHDQAGGRQPQPWAPPNHFPQQGVPGDIQRGPVVLGAK